MSTPLVRQLSPSMKGHSGSLSHRRDVDRPWVWSGRLRKNRDLPLLDKYSETLVTLVYRDSRQQDLTLG